MTAAELRLLSDERARHHTADLCADADIAIGEKDARALERRLNVIVPLSFSLVSGKRTASCFVQVRDVLDVHFSNFYTEEALFSEQAFRALDAAMQPYLDTWGYRTPRIFGQWGRMLLQDRADAVPVSRILADTRRMTADSASYPNLTSMKTADCIARGAYMHIADGQIVCVAAVNQSGGVGECVEIGVECAPAYRRQGLAVSCVCALTEELCREGKTVLWRHYHTNIASAKTAESAGFLQAGRFFAYTCFAK